MHKQGIIDEILSKLETSGGLIHIFDDGNYCFCLIAEDDAEDLLKVYSDGKAVPFFQQR